MAIEKVQSAPPPRVQEKPRVNEEVRNVKKEEVPVEAKAEEVPEQPKENTGRINLAV